MRKIQVLRGEEKDLPQLDAGEFGYTLDTKKLFIGSGEENREVTAHLNIDELVDNPDFEALVTKGSIKMGSDVNNASNLPSSDDENTIRYVINENQSYIRKDGSWVEFARISSDAILGNLKGTKPVNQNLIRHTNFQNPENIKKWGAWPNENSTIFNAESYGRFIRLTNESPNSSDIGIVTPNRIKLSPGERVTITFEAAGDTGASHNMDYLWWINSSALLSIISHTRELTGETVNGHQARKHTIVAENSTFSTEYERNLLIGTSKTRDTAILYVTEPKVEYGEVATPYTRHPHDVDDDVESLVQQTSRIEDEIGNLNRDTSRRTLLTEYSNLVTSNNNWGDAMERALSENDVVVVPPGEYLMRDVTVPSNKTITGYGEATVIRATGPNTFRISGELHETPIRVTADVGFFGNEITVQSTNNFEVDGDILLRSQRDSLWEPDAGEEWCLGYATTQGQSLPFGEFLEIESISGNTLRTRTQTIFPDYFKDATREERPAQPYSTVTRVDFVKNVRLENFVIRRTNSGEAIRTRYAKDVRIDNVRMDGRGYNDGVTSFINFSFSKSCQATNCDYYVPGNVSPSAHHNINVYKATSSMWTGFSHCTAYGCTQAADISYIANNLPSTGCYVDNCTINYTSQTGLTSHGGTFSCRFSNNVINGTDQGINCRTRGALVANNVIIGNRNSTRILSYGIGLYEGHAVDCVVKGNVVRNFRNGLGIFDAVNDGEWFKYTAALFEGNSVTNCRRAFYIHRHPSRPDYPFLGVKVSNNNMRGYNPEGNVTTYVMELPEGVNGVTFDSNIIAGPKNPPSAYHGLYSGADTNNIRFINNNLRMLTTGVTLRGADRDNSHWPGTVTYYSMFGNAFEEVGSHSSVQTGRAMLMPNEEPLVARAPDGDKYWVTVDNDGNLRTERAFAQ